MPQAFCRCSMGEIPIDAGEMKLECCKIWMSSGMKRSPGCTWHVFDDMLRAQS